jgi:microcystin-dependent protein
MSFQVEPITPLISYGVGSTPQQSFVVPFPFDDEDDLLVFVDGTEALFSLADTTTDSGFYSGASVLLADEVSNAAVTIRRRTELAQEALFPEAGAFSVLTLNLELGRLWMAAQDLSALIGGTIRLSDSDGLVDPLPAADERAGKLLGFDAVTGAPIMVAFDQDGIQGPQGEPGPPGTSQPIGTVAFWPGATAPSGWLFCAGQAVNRTTYAALFAAIGTTHGAGDGTTTFNLPDMRSRFVLARDNMGQGATSRVTSAGSGVDGATLGAAGGDQRAPQHTHGITDAGHTHAGGAAADVSGHTHTVAGSDLWKRVTGASGVAGSPPATRAFISAPYDGDLDTYAYNAETTNATITGAGGAHDHAITVSTATTGVSVQTAGAGTAANVPPCIVLNAIIYVGGALAGTDVPAHTHVIADVDGLQGELDTLAAGIAAAVSLPIEQSDVTGLGDALAGKAAASHTHPASDITGLRITPYVFVAGTGTNGEEVLRLALPAACQFPAGAAGSYGVARVAATGTTTYSVKKNGTEFGTVEWAGAATTATVTIAGATSFAAGDVLSIEGPATADATLEDFGITLAGTYT